jgi:hypothetical protein
MLAYLFEIYLTTLLISQIMQRRMTELLVNNELERMLNEAVVARDSR